MGSYINYTIKEEEKLCIEFIDNFYRELNAKFGLVPILAGGSLRNWDYSRGANDLDIYIKVNEKENTNSLITSMYKDIDILYKNFISPLNMGNDQYTTVFSDLQNKILSVYELSNVDTNFPSEFLNGLNIQFIFHHYNSIYEVLNTFPVSISQIAYDPSNKEIIKSNDYVLGKNGNKIFFYGSSDYNYFYKNKYTNKILSYFENLMKCVCIEDFPSLERNFNNIQKNNKNNMVYVEDKIDLDSYKDFMRSL